MAKIEGMALNVVLQLAKAELMSAYRTDNVKIMSVGFDWDVCESDEDGERSLMVDACIIPEEECFKKDSGRHPWVMVWDENLPFTAADLLRYMNRKDRQEKLVRKYSL